MSKKGKKQASSRRNLYLGDTTHKKGEAMAKQDMRSFSGFATVLINNEWERRFGKGAA